MNLTTIVKLENDLWAINEMDKTIMYLINGAEKALLIDTGFGITDLKQMIKALCGDKEFYVINTHAHEDHNSGNNQFKCVYVGRFDEVYSHEKMNAEKKALFEGNYFSDAINQGYDIKKWNPEPCEHICTVKDGDEFDLGTYKFKVIEAPSHTLGSIVLWEENQGWMFTGDILLTWQVWGHLSNCFLAPSASLVNYYDSLLKLSKYKNKIKYIFPSHGMAENLPEGYSQYRLPASVLDIYIDGIKSIFNGTADIKDFDSIFEDGKEVLFSVGGIVFKENRMY